MTHGAGSGAALMASQRNRRTHSSPGKCKIWRPTMNDLCSSSVHEGIRSPRLASVSAPTGSTPAVGPPLPAAGGEGGGFLRMSLSRELILMAGAP
eukprot:CAMPEP_0175589266 /NCGR_PEP_ID=MMETSP0096-20121207/51721_1 /TAXON_ID=311494 /ORGANISM="Alexandrium monilatum, Strain CCMP3105" /LENGTH=94 /DNA_ID=CAMNT_0016893279 /DNA_START=520 /DNA_END=804 /DNA_ORIENTATION=+